MEYREAPQAIIANTARGALLGSVGHFADGFRAAKRREIISAIMKCWRESGITDCTCQARALIRDWQEDIVALSLRVSDSDGEQGLDICLNFNDLDVNVMRGKEYAALSSLVYHSFLGKKFSNDLGEEARKFKKYSFSPDNRPNPTAAQ